MHVLPDSFSFQFLDVDDFFWKGKLLSENFQLHQLFFFFEFIEFEHKSCSNDASLTNQADACTMDIEEFQEWGI